MSAPLEKPEDEGARIYQGNRIIWVIQNGRRVRPRGWNAAIAAGRAADRLQRQINRLERRGLLAGAAKLARAAA